LRPVPRRVGVLLAAALGIGVVTAAPGVQAASPQVHFTAAGDYNATSDTATVLNGIAKVTPDLHLALGDLAYGSSPTNDEQAWCDFVTSKVGAGFPFELISGNHESNGENGDINDFSACLPNQLPGAVGTYGRQWYVDYPKNTPTVRFILISPGLTYPDGAWSYAAGSPRYQWTSDAIDGARSAGIPWVVVAAHKPCISMGIYGCDGQNDIWNLLLSKKVDLVLTGHEHMYQRSKQLALGTGCTSLTTGSVNDACVKDGDDDLDKGAGTVIATVGTGGIGLRDVTTTDSEAGYFRTWSGLNVSPSNGFLDVTADGDTLSAKFTATTGSYSDAFTIRRPATPPANQTPTARMADPACTGLACTFDGTTSSDPDGSIASYAWDFGDGSTGTGATPSHTYTAAGTYGVILQVTDDKGATASVTKQVTVAAAPTTTTVASDTFTRTVSNGLGTADAGGAWTVTGTTSNYAVNGTTGRLVLKAGGSVYASLPGTAAATSTDLTTTLTTDKAATGSGVYISALVRRTSGGDYRGKVRLVSDRSVRLELDRATSGGTETVIVTSVAVPGLTYSPGDQLRLRVQAVGTSPTQLRAKVWKAGTTEPTTWTVTGSDSTTGLQTGGGVGFAGYMSSSATNAPVTVVVDDLLAVTPAP
jgi:PKD repeat protein